jgi:gluconolactonase
MKPSFFFSILILLSFNVNAQNRALKPLFIQDSLKLVSSQFKFTEGPSVDREGNIFFTDQPNNTIWKYGVDQKLTLYTKSAGRANGTYVDQKGMLVACADEHNELWIFNDKKPPVVLYKNPIGQELNGPNDLWIDHKGGIYFTDPYYQRDYWTRKSPAIAGEKVYYLPKGKSQLLVVEENLIRPNGIVGTPDQQYLYVADAKGGKTYRYEIQKDGTLRNRKLLINKGSDGMTLDEQGNIYLTGKGVDIFNPEGEQIGHIDIPENHTANVCFGGKNRDVLFITASKSIYVLPMAVKGVE